jgi:hypothetical protein
VAQFQLFKSYADPCGSGCAKVANFSLPSFHSHCFQMRREIFTLLWIFCGFPHLRLKGERYRRIYGNVAIVMKIIFFSESVCVHTRDSHRLDQPYYPCACISPRSASWNTHGTGNYKKLFAEHAHMHQFMLSY